MLYFCNALLSSIDRVNSESEGRFPLPELTGRVDGPCTRASGFQYLSWRPELTGVKNAPEFTGRKLGPWTRVVETDLDLCYMTAPHTLSVVIIIMLDGFIVVCYIVMTTHVFMLGMI